MRAARICACVGYTDERGDGIVLQSYAPDCDPGACDGACVHGGVWSAGGAATC